VPFGLENCVHPTYSRNDSKFLKFGGSHCSLLKSNKHEPMAEKSALFRLFFVHPRQIFMQYFMLEVSALTQEVTFNWYLPKAKLEHVLFVR
jgi:hypothetical protein